MTNKEKYDQIFLSQLDINLEQLNETLVYNSIKSWDSVGHMALMAALESEFDIMIDTDDIINFSSYPKGMEILAKYDIQF
jgi:acyl carrier protein